MKSFADQFVSLLGPPSPRAIVSSEHALSLFESTLDLKLPADYRYFCKNYGSCIIGQYLVIQAPGTTSRGVRYDDIYVRERANEMGSWVDLDPVVPGFVPNVDGGWLHFGFAFGDPYKLYWGKTGLASDAWSIVIHGPHICEEHGVDFFSFLRLLLAKKLSSVSLKRKIKKPAYEDFYDYFRRTTA